MIEKRIYCKNRVIVPVLRAVLLFCVLFFIIENFCGEPFLGLFFWEFLNSSSLRGIVGSNFSRVGDKINPSNSKIVKLSGIKVLLLEHTRSTSGSLQMVSNKVSHHSNGIFSILIRFSGRDFLVVFFLFFVLSIGSMRSGCKRESRQRASPRNLIP